MAPLVELVMLVGPGVDDWAAPVACHQFAPAAAAPGNITQLRITLIGIGVSKLMGCP